MCWQTGRSTRPHARVPEISSLTRDVTATIALPLSSVDRKTVLSTLSQPRSQLGAGNCFTSRRQTTDRLVQEWNIFTVPVLYAFK